MRALARDPERRFPDAPSFIQALARIAQGLQEVPTQPIPTTPPIGTSQPATPLPASGIEAQPRPSRADRGSASTSGGAPRCRRLERYRQPVAAGARRAVRADRPRREPGRALEPIARRGRGGAARGPFRGGAAACRDAAAGRRPTRWSRRRRAAARRGRADCPAAPAGDAGRADAGEVSARATADAGAPGTRGASRSLSRPPAAEPTTCHGSSLLADEAAQQKRAEDAFAEARAAVARGDGTAARKLVEAVERFDLSGKLAGTLLAELQEWERSSKARSRARRRAPASSSISSAATSARRSVISKRSRSSRSRASPSASTARGLDETTLAPGARGGRRRDRGALPRRARRRDWRAARQEAQGWPRSMPGRDRRAPLAAEVGEQEWVEQRERALEEGLRDLGALPRGR